MLYRYRITFLLFLYIFTTTVYGQGSDGISGTIVNELGNPIKKATIQVAQQTLYTQENGSFQIANISVGKHIIRISALGYTSQTDTIDKLPNKNFIFNAILYPENRALEQVTVEGKTQVQQIKEQPIRAIVIDTKAAAEQPTSLAEVMNRASGIRIRQSGGVGNQVDVSINGFQGNAVQYFRDGIPLEYLGGGYSINNVPINQLEHVEIYKGVVPISLGGDALGGAVNLVTNQRHQNVFQASYEIASFNTHLINLSWQRQFKNNWFAGIDAFSNISDNDYKVDVEIVNQNANLEPARVRLFHNAYKHYFTEAFVGLKDKKWADELKLSVALYQIDRQSQHPALMTNPYGAVKLRNKGFIPSIRYKKNFWNDRITVDQFVSYSQTNRGRTDTIKGTFDWYCSFTPGTSIGESPNPSLADIDYNNIISRTAVSFAIDEHNSIYTNYTFNHNKRVGSDPLGFKFTGTDVDVLSKEATYEKSILGISWESNWLNKRLTNQLFVKHFSFTSKGTNAFLSNATDLSKYKTISNQNWGMGNAIKYQLNPRSFVRASVELTSRLPLQEELFGNNDTRAPNFELQPERSFNVNVGYRYATERYSAEVGTFYRKTKGMILLVPIQSPFAQYQNLDSVQGYGFDLDLSYRIFKNIELTGNATWQDIRMIDIGTPLYKWIEGTRLTNTPYFFSNLGIRGNFKNIFSKNDAIKPYIHYNYIREFYLINIPRDKESGGFLGLTGSSQVDTKDLVPDQHLVNMGFNYIFSSSRFSLGTEIKNITDAKLYDYYKIQRPGRSIHFKINYIIK